MPRTPSEYLIKRRTSPKPIGFYKKKIHGKKKTVPIMPRMPRHRMRVASVLPQTPSQSTQMRLAPPKPKPKVVATPPSIPALAPTTPTPPKEELAPIQEPLPRTPSEPKEEVEETVKEPKMPTKVTKENYDQVPIPKAGVIGKKYAPLIDWENVPKQYQPPPKGSVMFFDYPSEDAPNGVLRELREAFKRNREYVAKGKDPVNVLLHGPPGTGKSMAVKKFAEETQLPYYYVPAEPGAMTSEQLLGKTVLETTSEGTKSVWKDGTIVKAARTGGILHIDEFSLLDPEVTPRLHELLDSNRRISMEQLSGGEPVKAHPDLFVIVSCNPAELGVEGVKPISSPIRSRTRGIYMDYAPLEHEMKIVKKQVGFTDTELNVTGGKVGGKYGADMLAFMQTLRDIRGKQSELTYVPTAREAVDFGRELKSGTTCKQAVHRALVGKYVGDDRAKIEESVKAHLQY